jgi:acyl dehydratase
MSYSLDEIKKYVGTEAEPIEYIIDSGAIKLFADSIMDNDPLYCDEEYAKTTKYGGIIAPQTFFGGATSVRGLKAGDSRTMSAIPLPIPSGWTSIAAGDDFQFFSVIRPGDILTCCERIAEAYEKQGRSGHLIFVTREKTYTNQYGKIVMIRKLSGVSFKPSSQNNTTGNRYAVPYSDTNSINTELSPLTVGPVTIRYLAMFAVATAEFVDIHYDREYAQSAGLPDVIIQGLYKTSVIARMLKNWTGDGTLIQQLTVQHRSMDVAGNTLTAGGRIIESNQNENSKLTKCEVWVNNQHGQRTTIGTAKLLYGGDRSPRTRPIMT